MTVSDIWWRVQTPPNLGLDMPGFPTPILPCILSKRHAYNRQSKLTEIYSHRLMCLLCLHRFDVLKPKHCICLWLEPSELQAPKVDLASFSAPVSAPKHTRRSKTDEEGKQQNKKQQDSMWNLVKRSKIHLCLLKQRILTVIRCYPILTHTVRMSCINCYLKAFDTNLIAW